MPFTHDKAYGSSNLPAPITILGRLERNIWEDMWQSGLMHHTWNMTYLGTMSSNLILSALFYKAVIQTLFPSLIIQEEKDKTWTMV